MRRILVKRSSSILCLAVLLWAIFINGCSDSDKPQTGGTGQDQSKAATLANKAKAYISGGPTWFLAPTVSGAGGVSDGSSKNTSGAVAWNIQTDDLVSFRQRITNSSISGQTTWYQYTCVGKSSPCGFPFGSSVNCEDAGMTCYSLVVNAMKDAGYTFSAQVGDCDYFRDNYAKVTSPQVGDLVLYDWPVNGQFDGSYDHVGIITGNTTAADPCDFLVISAANVVQEFSLGAAEKALGVWNNIPSNEGGESNYKYIFVRPR